MFLTEGQLKFDFSNAIQAFKFDEVDQNSPYYHGVAHCMKAVDFIVERENDWLFVEVKDYGVQNQSNPTNLNKSEKRKKLLDSLVGKYKDTFLYRWAEGKIDDKPVHYVCLVELNDDALILNLMHALKQRLPIGSAAQRWQGEIVKSATVVNINKWNAHFSDSLVMRR